MPTLAAKNSQARGATTANMATVTATPTTATVNSGGCSGEPASTPTTQTDTTNTSGGAFNQHYHHPPAPNAAPNASSAVLPSTTSLASGTTTSAGGASATTTAASLATFNGNSNLSVANGNQSNNNNNSNIHNKNANSNGGNSNSAGGVVGGSAVVFGKKPINRADIASPPPPLPTPNLTPPTQLDSAIPSASPLNNHHHQQLTMSNSQGNHHHHQHDHHHHQNNSNISNGSNGSANNNNSNNNKGNGNGSGNINSILKGSKENLLQNCYSSPPTNDAAGLEVDDPGDGLGPLPPKWETAYTERGELYFIDHNTGTSHWLDPRLSKFQKKSLEDCGDDELPYGWEKIEDSLYGTYYIDHVNRRTQYENPVLEAKRRAAEQRQKTQQQPPPPQPRTNSQNVQNNVGSFIQRQSPSSQQQSQRSQTPSTLNGSNVVDVDDLNQGGPPNASSNMLDMSQRGMQPPPANASLQQSLPNAHLPYKFTRNPVEMQGERITASLVKSARGLGITIVGGDDGAEEYLQIKSIVPHGPAWLDGQLQTGDVLVYVNDTCVLGFTHHEMVNIFQSILPGETATLEVCRGYPLPFDPNDPNTEVVTTIAVDGVSSVAATDKQRRILLDLHMEGNYSFLDSAAKTNNHNTNMRSQHSPAAGGLNDGFILMKKPDLQIHTFSIVKGAMGFGFTIADSAYGQKVKKILDYNSCTQLQEGDVLLEINGIDVRQQTHLEVVQILKDCSKTEPTNVKIQRGNAISNTTANVTSCTDIYSTVVKNPPATKTTTNTNNAALGNVAKLRKNFTSALFRSKTPTADLYSTQQKEILPIRPKTPLVDTRHIRAQTPNEEKQQRERDQRDGSTSLRNDDGRLSEAAAAAARKSPMHTDAIGAHKSTNSLQELEAISQDIPYLDPYPKLVTSLSERLAAGTSLLAESGSGARSDVANAVGGLTMGSGGGYHHTTGTLASMPSSVVDTMRYDHHEYATAGMRSGHEIYGMSPLPSSAINNFYAPPPHLSIATSNYALPTTALSLTTPSSTTHHNLLHHHPLQQLPPPPPPPLTHIPHSHAQGSQYSPALFSQQTPLQAAHIQNERMQKRVNELLSDRRRVGFATLDGAQSQARKQASPASYSSQQQSQQPASSHLQHSPAVSSVSQQAPLSWLGGSAVYSNTLQSSPGGNISYLQRNGGALDMFDELTTEQYELSEITLERQALGFGFRIVGGTEEGSQVTVGHIVPGGAADNDHRINTGDEILSIDGINVVNSSHHKVVSLMGEAALRGQVTMILRRRLRLSQQPHMMQQQMSQHQLHPQQQHQLSAPPLNNFRYPYDVIVSRHETEGFGFVIISSSNQYYGSTIGKLIPGSPADRCGELKVGDRIVAVNRINIAGMSHGDVVNLIKESGLHVRLTIGCPKDTLATTTTTTSPNNMARTRTPTLLVNSAQVSPGQLSQTQMLYAPLTTQQQQQKPHISPSLLHNNDGGSGSYFIEHPHGSATGNFNQQQTQLQQQQQQQLQQQQQQQQLPPQL